jgi:acyl carrier protein
MNQEIRQYLIGALVKMGFAADRVNGDTSLGPAGIDLDSLAVADLVMQLNDRFAVSIDEDEAELFAMLTIDQIAEAAASRITVG